MTAEGKPRRPGKTKENKTGTLRYEQETETWHCGKRPKEYSKRNAVSAKSHAAAHTKEEKKNGSTRSEETRREEAVKTRTNSGYEHCKTTDKNIGEDCNQNNTKNRRTARTKKTTKTPKESQCENRRK